jgi:PTS system mannose-specific IIC component
MSDLSVAQGIGLVAWGTVVGIDLVSLPQGMLSRPVVAGTVAGAIAGDIDAGLRVGVALELFALDVLPIGASRYPDYGPATVAAVAFAANSPWELSLGAAVALGLLLAVAGGWAMQWLRHANARAIQRHAAALAAGEARAVRQLQFGGIGRDVGRSALLSLFGVGIAVWASRDLRLDRVTAEALTLVILGSALAAAIGGALRSAGAAGRRLQWLGVGLVAGTIGALLQ